MDLQHLKNLIKELEKMRDENEEEFITLLLMLDDAYHGIKNMQTYFYEFEAYLNIIEFYRRIAHEKTNKHQKPNKKTMATT